jgi:hypothetical protein
MKSSRIVRPFLINNAKVLTGRGSILASYHTVHFSISDVFGNIKYVLVLDIHFLKEVEEIFLKYNEKIWRYKEFTPVWGYIRKLSLILTDEI